MIAIFQMIYEISFKLRTLMGGKAYKLVLLTLNLWINW
jgi:hypothetical protein